MRSCEKIRIGKKTCTGTAKANYSKHSYLMEETDQSRMVPKDDYMLTACSAQYKGTHLQSPLAVKLATVNPGLP